MLIVAWIFAAGVSLPAQEIWTLQRAVEHARQHNLSVQLTRENVRSADLSERTAKASRLPNIGGQVNAGRQFGRTVDPTTNQFVEQQVTFSSMSLTASATIFNGGLVHHNIKQAKYNLAAARADVEQAENNIGLQVAEAYLSTLLAEEQEIAAQRRVAQSKKQLEQTDQLIRAGNLPQADRYNILAQIARDEQSLVIAQNNIDLAYLALKQLLQLEPDYFMKIEHPQVQIPEDARASETLTLSNLYTVAQNTQPSLRAADYRAKAANVGLNIAKASYWPSLSIFGTLNDNYSSAFPDQSRIEFGTPTPGPEQPVLVNGTPVLVQFITADILNVPTLPFWDQMDQNFGQNIGVSLNIPIYQNNSVRLLVERARLNLINTELQNNTTRQQLKNDIQTAIANVKAGRLQYEAAQRTFESTQTAYNNTERRQTLGASTTLELTTAKTNLDIAENDLLVARYQYLFRLKILDFYLGKPLSIN